MKTSGFITPVALLAVCVRLGAEAAPASPVILVPLVSDGQPVAQAGPDGRPSPVLQPAPESKLRSAVEAVLRSPFVAKALRMERLAARVHVVEERRRGKSGAAGEPGPLYLLLSQEQGGFARDGFWLEEPGAARRFLPVPYVDVSADLDSVEGGDFEETFLHETWHVVLHTLLGAAPTGPSRKMHMSLAVTDYAIAFDEGFAEHIQPLARDETANAALRALDRGREPGNLRSFWHSRVDRRMRSEGVRANLFVHAKLPGPRSRDPYRELISDETSPAFDLDTLKNGAQMMASEGVVATLFYRLSTDERLRGAWRDAGFYAPLLDAGESGAPREHLDPWENVSLKLFTAIAALGRAPLSGRPLALEMVAAYGERFPEEKATAYEVFLTTTYGATASRDVAAAVEAMARKGRVGDFAFAEELPAMRKRMAGLVSDAAAGRVPLDAALGPEIWLLNGGFKIARAVWETERTIPFTLNLNTATAPELLTVPGMTREAASAIVAARRSRGAFASVTDLRDVKGVTPAVVGRLEAMRKAMDGAPPYERP